MIREEAIEILKKLIPVPKRADGQSTAHLMITIALEMAISALKQSNCDDCKYKIFTNLYFHTDPEMAEQQPCNTISKEASNKNPCDDCIFEEGSKYCIEHCPHDASRQMEELPSVKRLRNNQKIIDKCLGRDRMQNEICNDNRFELIEKYKQQLLEATNIETSIDEMKVIDNILFRFWQMGWLDKLEQKSCDDAISREMALDGVDAMYNNSWNIKDFRENVNLMLNKLPSVQPSRKGHWIKSDIPNEEYVCSKCGGACWYYDYQGAVAKSNFCPNCGADMRGAECLK